MTIKASGRSALILATGLFVCFAGPSPAPAAGSDGATATSKSANASSGKASSGKSVKQGARHWKRYTHRKYTRTASKSAESRKASEKDGAADTSSTISSSVANANAQMASTDSASALTAKATPCCWRRRTNRAMRRPIPTPVWSPPINSTTLDRAAAGDPGQADCRDGLSRQAGRSSPCSGREQRQLHLGPDFADRQDLHCLRRLADDGVRRAHVHGVTLFAPT